MEKRIKERKSFKTFMASERAKGILSIILWLGITFILQTVLIFLFRDTMEVEGTENEEFFRSLAQYMPSAIVLIVFIFRYFTTLKEDVKRLTKKNIIFIVIAAVAAIVLSRLIAAAMDYFGVISSNDETIRELMAASVILPALMALIYAPVVEELLFRKALNQIVNNKIIFVILSALSFALTHTADLTLIAYAVAGALYAIVYLKTDKNIVASITVHFIWNLIGVILMLLGIAA